jgi:hypothetical protein
MLELLVLSGIGLVAIDCSTPSPTAPGPAAPNSPAPGASSLLSRVQAAGFGSAQRVEFGRDGAALIAIQGGVNWNFFVNDQPLGIGLGSLPSIDVANISVPDQARLDVRNV